MLSPFTRIVSFSSLLGSENVYDYDNRLRIDELKLTQDSTPQWKGHFRTQVRLDLSLVSQILSGHFADIGSIQPGLSERFIRSSADGTMQPYAMYIPRNFNTHRSNSLVVMLHGNGEAESELLAYDFLRRDADATGSILIAPWGRNSYNFRGLGYTDVEDVISTVERVFRIDQQHVYLFGYSMGGFAAYEVAVKDTRPWRAIMSIAGSLLGEDTQAYMRTQRRTPLYILTGKDDPEIPTEYPTQTASYLSSKLFAVSYYQQPHGTHILATLQPIIDQSWGDMFNGTVRAMGPVVDPSDQVPHR